MLSSLRRPVAFGGLVAVVLAAIAFASWVLLPRALVESDPSGASVIIDGLEVGRTQLRLSSLLPASWEVRIEAPGHLPLVQTARAGFGQPTPLRATLVPLPGRLSVTAEPDGARVEVDGVNVGPAPVDLSGLAVGRHRVVIYADDHRTWEGEVQIAPGNSLSHHAVLRPMPARFTLTTPVEDATMFVDDVEWGTTSEQVEVEPGARRIRVEALGYRPWRRLLHLLPNEARELDIVLQVEWPDVENGDLIYPLAVIVENQEQARPQAGLDRADVVYEALAEGGITRFLAVYATSEPEVVGPVRSARHYFVHWAREFGAPLVHIGGSPQAYAALAHGGPLSLDAMAGTGVFWRTRERAAPHNAYTSIPASRSKLGNAASSPGSFGGLQFRRGGLRLSGPPAPSATASVGAWSYTVTWTHDAYANDYVRAMDGAPHVDASGHEIHASNVLFQWAPARPMAGDRAGRLEIGEVGSGALLALIDGVAIEGSWSKATALAPTEYRDAEGKPLRLNAGPTWIQVLPLDGHVAW